MASRYAMPLDELPPGTVREVVIDNRTYALCNVDGCVFALSGDCPHRNGPLGHGALHGHILLCPWHLWRFDVRTGESDMGSDCRIATYPATVQARSIHIEIT